MDHLNRKLAQATINSRNASDDDRDSEDEIVGVVSSVWCLWRMSILVFLNYYFSNHCPEHQLVRGPLRDPHLDLVQERLHLQRGHSNDPYLDRFIYKKRTVPIHFVHFPRNWASAFLACSALQTWLNVHGPAKNGIAVKPWIMVSHAQHQWFANQHLRDNSVQFGSSNIEKRRLATINCHPESGLDESLNKTGYLILLELFLPF